MAFIIFPDISFNHIYFLFLFIVYFIKTLINILTKDEINDENENDKNIRTFFNIYIYTISDLISIIFVIIEKKRTVSKKRTEIEEKTKRDISQNNVTYIVGYNNEASRKKLKLIFHLFLISFTDLLAQFIILVFSLLDSYYIYLDYLLIFNIFFQYFFCRILLKKKYYRHHYLSFIINIISLLIFSIVQHCNSKVNITNLKYIIFALIMILNTGCYSFGNVIGKIVMTNNFLTPYSLLMWKGTLELILLLLSSIPFFFIKFNGSILFSGFSFYFKKRKRILLFIALMICNYWYNVFIWTITDRFSPSHLTMANVLEVVAFKIFEMIYYKKIDVKAFEFIIYLFLIIAAAIHNEIVIINICKLNEKTKRSFDEKALDDLIQAELFKEGGDLNDSNTIEMIPTKEMDDE